MTGSAESPHDLRISGIALSKRGLSFSLRLATRFPLTSGTAKQLAIGAGGHNVMARTLREVGASLVVRDPVPDGRNLVCERSSSPRWQLQRYFLFQPSHRT